MSLHRVQCLSQCNKIFLSVVLQKVKQNNNNNLNKFKIISKFKFNVAIDKPV